MLWDFLVEMASECSFVPQLRHDILVEAIETKEHGECFCGVG